MDVLASPYRKQSLAVLASIQSWGYDEVQLPPWLELERIATALSRLGTETCKFIAPDQRVLVLLPDPTLGVLAQGIDLLTECAEDPGIRRVCYWADAYRVSSNKGWTKITQVGGELLGLSSPEADAEVVTVAVDAVAAAGKKDCRVFVNDVTLTNSLCSLLGEDVGEQARQALTQGDFVTLQRLTAGNQLLGRALRFTGSPDEIQPLLEQVVAQNTTADGQLTGLILERGHHLTSVCRLVAAAGYPVELLIDTSLVREVGYYDGFVFQVLERGTGSLLAGGGRYDSLLAAMGLKAGGGAGFACNLTELIGSGEEQVTAQIPDYVILGRTPDDMPQAWAEAGRLRRAGFTVRMQYSSVENTGLSGACRRALLIIDDGKLYQQPVSNPDTNATGEGGAGAGNF